MPRTEQRSTVKVQKPAGSMIAIATVVEKAPLLVQEYQTPLVLEKKDPKDVKDPKDPAQQFEWRIAQLSLRGTSSGYHSSRGTSTRKACPLPPMNRLSWFKVSSRSRSRSA